MTRRLALVLVLALAAASLAAAQEARLLQEEFWTALDPVDINVEPEPVADTWKRLNEEARWVFSGMVYGFTFRYVPSDIARGVDEIFELEPAGSIAGRDMTPVSWRYADNRMYGFLRYEPKANEAARMEFWESNVIPAASGRGMAHYGLGDEGRVAAHREALKEAVRAWLRPRSRNKPKLVTGELLLVGAPSVYIDEGSYVSVVKAKIRIARVESYGAY